MSTSSRSISRKMRQASGKKPSQTPGKLKNEWCQKSELKTWGATAKPWELKRQGTDRFNRYCALVDKVNK